MKALDKSFSEQQKEIKRRHLEIAAERFFKQWAPDDPSDAARFHAELYILVRKYGWMPASQWRSRCARWRRV